MGLICSPEASRDPSTTWEKYQGIKVTCWDKDLVGSPDFLGEGFLWFNEEILPPPAEAKDITLTLQSRPKKKEKVTGYLTLHSRFRQVGGAPAPQRRAAVLAAVATSASDSATTARAVARSDLVQISATGRREVKIPTTTIEKFHCFGELPALRFDANESSAIAKEHSKYGFDRHLALWLTTCCQLAYKGENCIQAVCCSVWGKSIVQSGCCDNISASRYVRL